MKLRIDVKFMESNRERMGLTKSQFSFMIGYANPSGYSNLIKKQHIPDSKRLTKIANKFGCEPMKLLIIK